MVVTAGRTDARNMFLVFKNYLCIVVCQHGVYLEIKVAGSNLDGFMYVNREFKLEVLTTHSV